MGEPTPYEMHANYVYSLRRVATLGEGATSVEMGPWFLMDAGIGESSFNIGVLLREPDDVPRSLAQAEAWFATRGLRALRFDLRADIDAPMIEAALATGYVRRFSEPALSLFPLPTNWSGLPEMDVWRAQSEQDVAAYVHLEAEEYDDRAFQAAMTRAAMQMDQCVLVLGAVNGRPVARALVVVTGRMAGIHNVYVPPSLRNRGYGAAITVAAIEAGQALGADAACLEATDLGLPVYERLGFRKRFEYLVVGTPARR